MRKWGIRSEDLTQPAESYRSFSEFFSRRMHKNSRTVECRDPGSLVSPVDGRIVHMERLGVDLSGRWITQVKGARYNIVQFLGSNPETKNKVCNTRCAAIDDNKQASEGNRDWFYCVLYLSPSDYHHFHSPCDLQIHWRRHFSGEVLPVFPSLASRLNNLFSVNERVVLKGSWDCGEMYYAAIAAYNVADIRISLEPELATNKTRLFEKKCDERVYGARTCSEDGGETDLQFPFVKRGEEIGEFRLGSTVVLIFQAKKDFDWKVFIDENPPPYVTNALIYNTETHKQEESELQIFRAEKAEQATILSLKQPRARHKHPNQPPAELPFVINKIRKTEKEGLCMDTMVSLFGTPSSSSDDETGDSIKPPEL